MILAGGAFAAYQYGGAATPASQEQKPEGDLAAPVKADNKILVDAHLEPLRHAAITFPSGGVVAEVLVKEGDQVKAGQVLARLNAAAQRAAVAQAEASLQRAQARLTELKAGPRPAEIASARAAVDAAEARLAQIRRGPDQEEVDRAAADVNRAQLRLTSALQGGRQGEIDAAQASLDAAESYLVKLTRQVGAEEVAAAEADVRRAQAQVDLLLAGQLPETLAVAQADVAAAAHGVEQARASLENTELKAAFDGTVAVLDLKAGEVVSPGTPVVRLADLSGWQVVTDDLSELSVARIREGAEATIKFDAIPDLELPGTVSRIRMFGEKKQGDLTFEVIITPQKFDQRMRWNMTATVSIQGR